METKSLESAHLVFSLALAQHFFTIHLSLHFGTEMYILCRDMLDVYDLLFNVDTMGLQLRDSMNLRGDFALLNVAETGWIMGTFEVGLNTSCTVLWL